MRGRHAQIQLIRLKLSKQLNKSERQGMLRKDASLPDMVRVHNGSKTAARTTCNTTVSYVFDRFIMFKNRFDSCVKLSNIRLYYQV